MSTNNGSSPTPLIILLAPGIGLLLIFATSRPRPPNPEHGIVITFCVGTSCPDDDDHRAAPRNVAMDMLKWKLFGVPPH